VATQISNSAYHGAALDRKHIGSELTRFLNDLEEEHGITRGVIAEHGVYLSHETCTHASPTSRSVLVGWLVGWFGWVGWLGRLVWVGWFGWVGWF
jgi:hypothetical protein